MYKIKIYIRVRVSKEADNLNMVTEIKILSLLNIILRKRKWSNSTKIFLLQWGHKILMDSEEVQVLSTLDSNSNNSLR
jgi:hypothetical protein